MSASGKNNYAGLDVDRSEEASGSRGGRACQFFQQNLEIA
jgi:hypothetical protein